MPRATGPATFVEVKTIYDQHRFFDAWQASAPWWTPRTDLDALSAEELVFGGRMAVRLGGGRLSRSLFGRARKKAPDHPQVRYFASHLPTPRQLLLDELAAFEASPELAGADTEARANWLSGHAYTWARLRNHKRAMALLEQAHAISPDNAWIHAMEADVFGMADDWTGSLAAAERAWALDRRASWSGTSLAAALMNCGEMEEAVRRLELATEQTQSPELLRTACWYQCALAEVLDGNQRAERVARAKELVARIEPLAPLADREFHAELARTQLDIAQLSNDHAAMERWADAARSPFHRQMLKNLKQHPAGRLVRLPYRRRLQKHQECVPTSVTSALSATGVEISLEELAAEVTFGGTAEWAAADWLCDRGLHVRFFAATVEMTIQLIEAGIGFIVAWEDDEGGHAVAIVGFDDAAGIVLAHDPTSFRTAEYLFRVFADNDGPLGVLAMAAVPAERAAELDAMMPPTAAIVAASQAHQKAMTLYGPAAARLELTGIAEQFPEHPGTRYLQALQDLQEGRTGQALASFRALMEGRAHAPHLRANLINACHAGSNTALLHRTLQTVVEMGSEAGNAAGADWVRPHPRYICDYADLLRQSAETRDEAERLLRSVLKTNWTSSYAWHVLADLRWGSRASQHEIDTALLAYSIASFLAPHNEHYARAYADALAHEDRVDEGLAWLEERAHRLGGSAQGVSTWVTWIGALEDRGYPARALTACREALHRYGDVVLLLTFAVPFLVRIGRWEEAEQQLDALRASEGRGAFQEAAVSFHRMQGHPAKALQHAEEWVKEFPRSMAARYAVLNLLTTLQGNQAAAARAAQWMREHPDNEDFEAAFCQYAQDEWKWRRIRVLRRRVKRNREDGWAWRELVFLALGSFETGDAKRRLRLKASIEHYLAEVERIAPGDAVTVRARALWDEDRERWRPAVDGYVQAIDLEPEHFYAYRRAWECSARLPEAERRALWATIEPIYLRNTGPLPNALEMMGLLARRFGVRETEAIVAAWTVRRPDDPNVVEALADLLLDYGQGRKDAVRALELLRAAVERFPYQSGLRFSLARACRATQDYEAANEVFEELVRRRPDNNAALIQLAWIQQRRGETTLALATLDRAQEQEPTEAAPFDHRAQILIDCNRYDEAKAVLSAGLATIPRSVPMYERAIALFAQCGDAERAVQAARDGIRAYPWGAYLWLLLGKTLSEHAEFAAPGEVEACLRKSLAQNHGLYDAADWMAMFLVEQHRDAEAMELLRDLEPRMADRSAVLGRMAWVKRRTANRKEALTDLTAVVTHAPWYAWGWNLLLTWLEEDKDLSGARTLLETAPPPMSRDLEFQQKRLQLLKRAGAPASAMDPEWDELLRAFPEDIPLHLRRYDALDEEKRYPEAFAALQLVLPIAADNAYLLARMVQSECRERKFAEAQEHGLIVCFAKLERTDWPVDQVWKHMRGNALAEDFARSFHARLQAGEQPTPHALALYAEHLLTGNEHSSIPKWLQQSRLNAVTRNITKLLRLVEQSPWSDVAYLAELLTLLNKHSYRKLVIASWKRLSREGHERNTAMWAQVGNAMINLGKKREARALLADWRQRSGVQMWMVCNYLLTLPHFNRAALSALIASSEDAMAGLPHDHSARYIAYLEVEAHALAGDATGLLAACERYSYYVDGPSEKGEFFPESKKYLIREVENAVRYLKAGQHGRYRRLVWMLRVRTVWTAANRKKLRRALILLLRVAFLGSLLWSAIARLFQ